MTQQASPGQISSATQASSQAYGLDY